MSKHTFTWSSQRINDPAHDMLIAFLIMDIQYSPEWCKQLITKINDVKSGNIDNWERIGNAFHLKLSCQEALLEDLVDEDNSIQIIPLKEFQDAVIAWSKECR